MITTYFDGQSKKCRQGDQSLLSAESIPVHLRDKILQSVRHSFLEELQELVDSDHRMASELAEEEAQSVQQREQGGAGLNGIRWTRYHSPGVPGVDIVSLRQFGEGYMADQSDALVHSIMWVLNNSIATSRQSVQGSNLDGSGEDDDSGEDAVEQQLTGSSGIMRSPEHSGSVDTGAAASPSAMPLVAPGDVMSLELPEPSRNEAGHPGSSSHHAHTHPFVSGLLVWGSQGALSAADELVESRSIANAWHSLFSGERNPNTAAVDPAQPLLAVPRLLMRRAANALPHLVPTTPQVLPVLPVLAVLQPRQPQGPPSPEDGDVRGTMNTMNIGEALQSRLTVTMIAYIYWMREQAPCTTDDATSAAACNGSWQIKAVEYDMPPSASGSSYAMNECQVPPFLCFAACVLPKP
jgi:hypothetical protein